MEMIRIHKNYYIFRWFNFELKIFYKINVVKQLIRKFFGKGI